MTVEELNEKYSQMCDSNEDCDVCKYNRENCLLYFGYSQGREEAYDYIEYIISDIENCCIDHTENADGEWETLILDYSKWADVFLKLRQLKENKHE